LQNACHLLVGEAVGHRQLGRLRVDERDNIKSHQEIVVEYDGACWIEQALGRKRWSTFVEYAVKGFNRQLCIS
jgi:hypothetical protein